MRLSSDALTSARQRYAVALYNQDYGGTTTPLCHFVKSTALRDMTRALIAEDREGATWPAQDASAAERG